MKSKIQTIRLPQSLFDAVLMQAEEQRTTIADFIRRAIAEAVERRQKTDAIINAIEAGRDAILNRLAELDVVEE